jgi:CheY-like chemotaxis protein
MDTNAAFEPGALARIEEIGGDALVARILGLFFDGAAKRLADAQAALAAGDRHAVGEALHSLRSSAAMVGAMRLAQLAGDGEQMASAGPDAGLAGLLAEAAAAFRQAEELLRPRAGGGDAAPTVAVIEDNADNRMLVRAILEPGCRVVEYADGAGAIAGCREDPPAAILLDISLPGMAGPEVLQRLRALPGLAAVPIIALTAHVMPGAREELLALGFDDYVAKPIADPKALRALVLRPRDPSAG